MERTTKLDANSVENSNEPRVVDIGGRTNQSCFTGLTKILSLITIEPLVFLSIMALYIEFPSIQDLIYTKICLQVITNHPNITQSSQPSKALDSFNSNLTEPQGFTNNATYSDKISFIANFSSNASQLFNNDSINQIQLSSMGKIQNHLADSNVSSGPSVLSQHHLPQTMQSNISEQFVCDRLNRTAIPKEIRLEIADGDSLFWLKYELLICTLCALSSPYWGGMSDKIGRLIPMNVPIFMSVLSNMLSLVFGLLISLKSHNLFKLEWLYIGALLTGVSGGQAVIMLNSFSFISDNTSSDNRTKRVVVLESVIYVAHSIGYYASKQITSIGLSNSLERPWLNRHLVAFSVCVVLNLLAILYAICKLRHRKFHRFTNNFEREQQETFAGDDMLASKTIISTVDGAGSTLARSRNINSETNIITGTPDRLRELTASTPDDLDGPIAQSDKKWTDFSSAILTFEYYKQTFETLSKRRESRFIIILLLLCSAISALCLVSLMSLLYLYLRNEPFNWNTSQYSSWNFISSLSRGTALICLTITKLFKIWNLSDPIVSAIGFLSKGTGLLMISLAQTPDIVSWSIAALTLSEYSLPPIRSLLSKLVVKEEVGKVYSCLAATQSLCILFGNVIFYFAYSFVGIHSFFRTSFLIVACLQFAAVLIMLFIYKVLRHRIMIV